MLDKQTGGFASAETTNTTGVSWGAVYFCILLASFRERWKVLSLKTAVQARGEARNKRGIDREKDGGRKVQ